MPGSQGAARVFQLKQMGAAHTFLPKQTPRGSRQVFSPYDPGWEDSDFDTRSIDGDGAFGGPSYDFYAPGQHPGQHVVAVAGPSISTASSASTQAYAGNARKGKRSRRLTRRNKMPKAQVPTTSPRLLPATPAKPLAPLSCKRLASDCACFAVNPAVVLNDRAACDVPHVVCTTVPAPLSCFVKTGARAQAQAQGGPKDCAELS